MRALLPAGTATGVLLAACSFGSPGSPAPSETIGTSLDGVVVHEATFAAG